MNKVLKFALIIVSLLVIISLFTIPTIITWEWKKYENLITDIFEVFDEYME